jgi:GNAT superfamily N-acetyltransferase
MAPGAAAKFRWRKAGRGDDLRAEQFLRSRERYAVAACAKFIKRSSSKDHIWRLAEDSGAIQGMIIQSGGVFLPVLGQIRNIPPLHFVKGLWGMPPIHLVQGLLGDALLLEAALADLGCRAKEQRDYDLMILEREPEKGGAVPKGLELRRPGLEDSEEMYPLQAGYEQEEVLPLGVVLNPADCRLSLGRILSREQSLIACLNKRIVGKINTNAASFACSQIGGVYVLPEYRGLGIGRRMTAVFAAELRARGREPILFVKKTNSAAQKIYRQVGFVGTGDYRISYY